MARLPDLNTEGVYVERPERNEWANRTKGFFAVLGLVVRKGCAAEATNNKGGKTNKSD